MKTAVLFLLGLLVLSTCKKKEEEEYFDITESCVFSDTVGGICFFETSICDELIINDYDSYKRFGDSVRSSCRGTNCETATLPNVDFAKYTMIAKRTSGSGCCADYNRKVLIDSKNKRVVYKVSETYSGFCAMVIQNMNWAYIPKIKDDYTVIFQFQKN